MDGMPEIPSVWESAVVCQPQIGQIVSCIVSVCDFCFVSTVSSAFYFHSSLPSIKRQYSFPSSMDIQIVGFVWDTMLFCQLITEWL